MQFFNSIFMVILAYLFGIRQGRAGQGRAGQGRAVRTFSETCSPSFSCF